MAGPVYVEEVNTLLSKGGNASDAKVVIINSNTQGRMW